VDGEVTPPILGPNAASASTVALAALVVFGHFCEALTCEQVFDTMAAWMNSNH
jgi:hypothetical protein